MRTKVVTYYLELTDPAAFQPRGPGADDVTFTPVDPPTADVNRTFYGEIGRRWHWFDRAAWTDAQWQAYLDAGDVKTWVLNCSGRRAGYIELQTQDDANVEIVYLGLLDAFTGRGLGSVLLTEAVARARDLGADRVWLHTCTLDDPRALGFYQAHGLKLYDQVESTVDLPD